MINTDLFHFILQQSRKVKIVSENSFKTHLIQAFALVSQQFCMQPSDTQTPEVIHGLPMQFHVLLALAVIAVSPYVWDAF